MSCWTVWMRACGCCLSFSKHWILCFFDSFPLYFMNFHPHLLLCFFYCFSTWLRLVFIRYSYILVTHFTPSDFINVRTHNSPCSLWSHVFCTLRFLFSCTVNFIWFQNYWTSCLFLQQPSVPSRVCYSVSRHSYTIFLVSLAIEF